MAETEAKKNAGRLAGSGNFASVSRGRCCLFLCEGDQGSFGTWIWIGVEDVEALLDEYRTRQESGILQRTTPGHSKCRSNTSMETFCGLALNQKATNRRVNGST